MRRASSRGNLMSRIRHCLECPNCETRYLISLSQFQNGSYVVSVSYGSCEEYILHCSCGRVASRWRGTGVRTCQVSRAAYERGYGTSEEIVAFGEEPRKTWRDGGTVDSNGWKLSVRSYSEKCS